MINNPTYQTPIFPMITCAISPNQPYQTSPNKVVGLQIIDMNPTQTHMITLILSYPIFYPKIC